MKKMDLSSQIHWRTHSPIETSAVASFVKTWGLINYSCSFLMKYILKLNSFLMLYFLLSARMFPPNTGEKAADLLITTCTMT